MKKILITVVIFLAIVCSSIFTTLYTSSKFSAFSNKLSSISSLVACSNWQLAQTEIENLIDEFERSEKKLQLFLNRNSLEDINQNLIKLKAAVIFKEKPKSATQILKLQNHFKKIAEDEIPLIQNIF